MFQEEFSSVIFFPTFRGQSARFDTKEKLFQLKRKSFASFTQPTAARKEPTAYLCTVSFCRNLCILQGSYGHEKTWSLKMPNENENDMEFENGQGHGRAMEFHFWSKYFVLNI